MLVFFIHRLELIILKEIGVEPFKLTIVSLAFSACFHCKIEFLKLRNLEPKQ